jgi:hypothetical protein
MYKLRIEHKTILKSIAFICIKLNDGLSKHQIYDYFHPTLDWYDKSFVDFSIEFGIENGWLVESDENRYVLTAFGKEFVSSQFET